MAMDLTTVVATVAVATRPIVSSGAETPVKPTSNKPMGFLAYANGALKRHCPTAPVVPKLDSAATVALVPAVSYKECMRNHAASIGGYALDGCCEFMQSPIYIPSNPTSLRCAACGCHRNFHRRELDDPAPLHLHSQKKSSFHHHCPPPSSDSPSSPPAPATSAFLSSTSNMLTALMKKMSGTSPETAPPANGGSKLSTSGDGAGSGGKKRFRTKFSSKQKEKMYEFSEKLGWKLQKIDKGVVEEFCNEVGVRKEVLKVWMHNNKNTLGRKEFNNGGYGTFGDNTASKNEDHGFYSGKGKKEKSKNIGRNNGGGGNVPLFEPVHLVSANGSSSSG